MRKLIFERINMMRNGNKWKKMNSMKMKCWTRKNCLNQM